jgi:Protein of unknown function (DUF1592)/Protein of unknown function (DUF1588)/Protein of unknown function (DUF1585)/Protein of unknown function (DUF1587)/Protein of unknown function (DUF1595)
MKPYALAAASAILLGLTGSAAQFGPAHLKSVPQPSPRAELPRTSYVHRETHPPRYAIAPEALTEVVHRVCGMCHNDAAKIGNLSLEKFDVAQANREAETAEKMIRKLRAGMMPPPGIPRPGGDTMKVLVETLERIVDAAAAAAPEPGSRTFQRLNRTEYARAIKDLLTLEVDAGSWLPLDTKSANFDNIADVQIPSATLLDSYLDAASEIARLAVGDANASRTSTTYKIPRLQSQWDQVEGAPMGTRGGVSAMHTFPADGEYVFLVSLHAIPTGQLFGSDAPFDEKIEVSVDGVRVGLLEVDRWMSQADAQGMDLKTPPVQVRAGSHRITAAFLRTFDGPVNDNIASIGHSIADTQIGSEQGITNVAHLREFTVTGPYNPTGVSETASRRKIFTCRPTKAEEERTCAEKIVTQLGSAAYRRPLSASDLKGLIKFYEDGAKDGGFEIGIRTALEAILASPHFIFRLEEIQGGARTGARSAINDFDVASRLSFFLWGTPPDDQLLSLARRGALADVTVLQAQAKRMLADPRSEALATRFAAQWLRLQDIEKNHPDALQFPDFHAKLAADMQRETELFFNSIVREDKSVLDLFRADYTYLNEDLAKHYGIKGVTGPEFRRVQYPNDTRRGLLGHASILTLTSHANRTSPVLRGKWVMEVLIGTPPPPPPPGVPDLEKTKEAEAGRMLTTRERMELHRSNEICRSCHQFMDPIGLALDNFDVTGQWRIRENGIPLDTKGTFYDGTDISNPAELQAVLLKRPLPLIRNFTQNLMAYGLGRRVEFYDQPVVRAIAREAAATNYKFSDFVLGIVKSDAFRMKRVPAAADDNASGAHSARQP